MNVDFTAIAPLIEQLAANLGVAAEHLWGVLLRQQINNAVSCLMLAIGLLFVTIVMRKLYIQYDFCKKMQN